MPEIDTSFVKSLENIYGTAKELLRTQTGAELGDSDFADILSKAMSLTEETNKENNLLSLNLLSGNLDDLSSVMIASEKAEIALSLTVAIRNKAIEAYKDIMSMQV
ncbi:MAG: flagellar hook-basal body complex protein FliE [Eubacteriales bacterium]